MLTPDIVKKGSITSVSIFEDASLRLAMPDAVEYLLLSDADLVLVRMRCSS